MFKSSTNLYIEKAGRLIRAVVFHGVENEPDESNQMYIILLNLFSIISFSTEALNCILFICIGYPLPGFLWLFTAFIWLLPIYLNRNGLTLSSRLIPFFYSNITLMACTCWFSHESKLDNYLIILELTAIFSFTSRERLWLFILAGMSSMLFVVESTHLQDYLPNLNHLPPTDAVNNVLLTGQTLLLLFDVPAYIYVSRLREKNLLSKRKQLEQMQQQVRRQNEDLKTFSVAAAHSMQTPLYVSISFLKKIPKTGEIDAEGNEFKTILQLIGNGLDQVEQLVMGLLSYHRIINIENEISIVDIEELLYTIKRTIIQKYTNAVVTLAIAEKQVKISKMLFSVILDTLIDNGLKYNRSLIPEIKIETIRTASDLVVYVRDNGIGIEKKHFEMIFQPFKRISPDPGIKIGSGLGLAGAKRAAERLGGHLVCLASSESGSVFELRIPLK